MKKQLFIAVTSLSLLALSGCGGDNTPHTKVNSDIKETEHTKAFFGDKESNSVVIADVDTMKLIGHVPTGHQITYTADHVKGQAKAYVVNRGSNAIDVLDTHNHSISKTITLEHYPRSAESMNQKLGLCEVSGMDKAMASIIDMHSDEVIAVVGDSIPVDPKNNPNHGGSHATGHPLWLDSKHFVLLDRYHRQVITYKIEKNAQNIWQVDKLSSVATTTSVHQIIPKKGNYQGDKSLFYGTAEGSDDAYPSLIEFKLTDKGLIQTRELSLQAEGVDKKDMWLHHGDFHPTKKEIYVGSGDGTFFVVDYEKMSIVKKIKVGKGAGHTMFAPKKDLAIVINHKDTFVTIINTKTDEKIKDVTVSQRVNLVGKGTIQAHPKYFVSKDSRYFYAFVTSDGILYKMDLDTLSVVGNLDVGGKPAQGSFISH